jgi:ornithine carbamoyltransferase
MRNLIELTDLTANEIQKIFNIADKINKGEYKKCFEGKTIILFFQSSSIRTRVTFEKGIFDLGGQSILFPSDTLDKKEDIKDVVNYLHNWADCIIVRHTNIDLIAQMAECKLLPIVNAMTCVNHPCEILSDLYSLSKIRSDYLDLNYLFVGAPGNIGNAWAEAKKVLGINIKQCCPAGYEISGLITEHDINKAIVNSDIILTDSLPSKALADFSPYQITSELMQKAKIGAMLNPCPPFFRGEEVSADIINSKYFVGYSFKKYLLNMHQAIMYFSMFND